MIADSHKTISTTTIQRKGIFISDIVFQEDYRYKFFVNLKNNNNIINVRFLIPQLIAVSSIFHVFTIRRKCRMVEMYFVDTTSVPVRSLDGITLL